MPDQSSHKTALQAPGYYALVYLSDMSGSEVLNATVSSTPTYPALNLAITVNSGSAANVKRGMRVVLESSVGAYKGTLVIRNAGTISSANLPLREFGKGFANVVSGDVLRVYNDFPPADKLVADDETFAPGEETYVDQNTNPAPVPASGGSWAGWLADAAAIPFTGSNSYTLGTGGTMTHAWSASGGTLSSGVIADPTFNPGAAGKYLITHAVTDNVNSKTRTQYVRVRAHDANDPPYEVILTQPPTCDEETGWKCRIRLVANADLATLRDYAHVILWVPSSAQTYGSSTPGRSHILMDGYLRRDEQSINPVLNTIEFDVISPLAALAELPGFSKVMVTDASPDAWSEFGEGDLDVQRAIIQLPLFYTTLIESGRDFLFTDFDNAEYSAFFLVKDNPLGQMRELARGRASRIVCLKNGRFEVQPLLAVQPLATRHVLPTTYTIDADDVDAGSDGTDGMVMAREHKRTVETFRVRGFTAGSTANDPVFAKWPEAPGMGNQSTVQEKFIVADTDQLFAWCGMLGAAEDGVFQNGSTSFYTSPTLRVPLRGAYWAIFDFYHEWIAISGYGASSNLRGVDLTVLRWEFRGLSLEWDETGLPRAVLELRAETAGEPGVDDTPEQTDIDTGTDTDVTPPLIDNPQTTLTHANENRIALITTGGVYLTTNFQAPVPTWTQPYATPWGGTLIQWVPDGFNPGTGWVFTTSEIGKLTLGSGAYSALNSNSPTLVYLAADASFAESGFVAGIYYDSGEGTVCLHATNGATFTKTVINATHPAPSGQPMGCYVSSKTPGRIIGGAFTAPTTTIAYASADHGASWAARTPAFQASDDGYAYIHAPWSANPSDNIFFYTAYVTPNGQLYRQEGAVITPITPTITGNAYVPNASRNVISTSVLNRNRMLLVGQRSTNWAVFLTDNAFAGTPIYSTVVAPGSGGRFCAMAGDAQDVGWLWGVSNYVQQLQITGGTTALDDKSGNLSDFGSVSIIGFAGY